jgi:flagellar motor switch protein FliM
MAECMTMEEIDKLLTAISNGEMDEDPINGNKFERKRVKIYDFRRPDVFSREQIRYISILHEKFARNCDKELSEYFHANFRMHVVSVDQLTTEEFIRSVPSPSCLFTMKSNEKCFVAELDPCIYTVMIDNIFGGSTEFKTQHELTSLEKYAIRDVAKKIFSNLEDTWRSTEDLKIDYMSIETSPEFLIDKKNIHNETGILLTIEVNYDDYEGMFNLFYPQSFTYEFLNKMTLQFYYNNNYEIKKTGKTIEKNFMENVLVPVKIELPKKIVKFSYLQGLKKNDVIFYGAENAHKIILSVSGKEIFNCYNHGEGKISITGLFKDVKRESFMKSETNTNSIKEALNDVMVTITVELGRKDYPVKEVLTWTEGSIVELDTISGEPLKIYANNVLIAKGECVVIDENFGVRITEIVGQKND